MTRRRLTIFLSAYLALGGLAALGYVLLAHPFAAKPVNGDFANRGFVTDMTYVDLPRLTTYVSAGGQSVHLRLDVALEVANKDSIRIQGETPQIAESLTVFLENVTPDQLRGNKTANWLRGEMLRVVNNVTAPVPVHDLLFRQFVQM